MNALNQYKAYQNETVGPEERIVVIYDGARRFVEQALAALESQRFEEVGLYTGKAQRVLEELGLALNFEAGQIAQNLYQLYDYWAWRLGQGLMKQDPAAFREVSAALADMREAWADAARQVRAQRSALSHG